MPAKESQDLRSEMTSVKQPSPPGEPQRPLNVRLVWLLQSHSQMAKGIFLQDLYTAMHMQNYLHTDILAYLPVYGICAHIYYIYTSCIFVLRM